MNLPHQAPIRFAQEIIEKKEDFFIIKCSFPYIPTLAMVSEAAAQSSAAFAQDKEAIGRGLFDEELVALGEDGVPFFDPLKHKAYIISGKTWVNNHAHVLQFDI